ncbi:MAG TPA: hydroxymethylglutaryl-CoA lyase [Terriglobia bacterium]|nr:hydroxymethylglutaryl-CoA lyase [Terriglobia bacterium]
MTLPRTARIVEVGPRSGLQNENYVLTTEDKAAFIRLLSATGLQDIEAVAFLNPRIVPQLADADELAAQLPQASRVRYTAHVPDMDGLAHAMEFGFPRISIPLSASETYSRKTVHMSVGESLTALRSIAGRAIHEGIAIRVSVSTCFVCPYEGPVAPEKVAELALAMLSVGVEEISIGDTIGAATPRDIETLLNLLLVRIPAGLLAMNFHDTYGMAIANTYQALQMGVGIFDGSAGGIGSCPFAPGAAGNVATEDLLFLFQRLGIETGISLNLMRRASRFAGAILGHPLPSHVLKTATAQEPS